MLRRAPAFSITWTIALALIAWLRRSALLPTRAETGSRKLAPFHCTAWPA